LILLTTGVVYVQLGNDVKIRVDDDKTTFYVLEDSRWVVAGREYNKMFDGVKLMYRDVAGIKMETNIDNTTKHVTIKRTTPYKRGPVVIDTYDFDGGISNVDLFPISHTVEVINGSEFLYQYEVRDLVYDGETIKDIKSPMGFGRNMKVEWEEGNYYSKVFKTGILKIKYRPTSNYENYSVRLFDPTDVTIAEDALNAFYAEGTMSNTVFINNSNGYVFYASSVGSGDLVYRKTTDGGITWGNAVIINSTKAYYKLAVWYDKWTPDDTGTIIHIGTYDVSSDDIWYYNLNISSDVVGGGVAAVLATTLSSADGPSAITKSTEGDLFVTGPTASGRAIARSTNDGLNWTDITPGALFDDEGDYEQLFPLSDGNIMVVYYDIIGDDAYEWVWNFTSTAWIGSQAAIYEDKLLQERANVGCTYDISERDIYICNVPDTDYFYIWKYDYSGDSWAQIAFETTGAGTVQYDCSLAYEQETDNLYITFTDGASGAMNVFSQLSTDGGSNWDNRVQINTVTDDIRFTFTDFTSPGRLYATWFNDDLDNLLGVTIFNITGWSASLSAGISSLVWRVPFGTGTTAYDVAPTGQTADKGVWNISNDGWASTKLNLKFNDTYSNVITECADDNAYSNRFIINTSYQTINASVGVGESFYLWCRRNYTAIPNPKNDLDWEFRFTIA